MRVGREAARRGTPPPRSTVSPETVATTGKTPLANIARGQVGVEGMFAGSTAERRPTDRDPSAASRDPDETHVQRAGLGFRGEWRVTTGEWRVASGECMLGSGGRSTASGP